MCTHVKSIADVVKWLERHDLLEEVEGSVADRGMREHSHARRAGPGDDGHKEDADEDGTLHPVDHEEDREDATNEDTKPCRRGPENAPFAEVRQPLDVV